MIAFDLHSAPLAGANLIEAGAGTGKTYAITGLFLRLIVERGLGVDQILVVTYTKAATEELKTRIRQRLAGARTAFAAGCSDDPLLAGLISRSDNMALASERLRDALLNFDRAAIFTIHGFCQRVLQTFAFETGQLFHSELMADALPLVQEAADDFWRRHISFAPDEIAAYILEKVKGPEQFATLCRYARFADMRVVPPAQKPDMTVLRPFRQAADQVLHLWPEVRSTIVQLLGFEGLNARSYGKCEQIEGRPGTARADYVNALAAALDRWPGRYPVFSHFNRFCTGFIVNATKKNQIPPAHPFFDLCQHTWDLYQAMEHQLDTYLVYLKAKFLQQVDRRLARKKDLRGVLFFDDLLLLVQQALSRQQDPRAARQMRKYYRAALVDEFQDTDPLQYDIFKRLFGSGTAVFFLIGDPKQAIYSFRGADLYAYLAASRDVASKVTLTRNWRSTPGLVAAVNAVFSRHRQPFGLEQIDFHHATAALKEKEEPPGALTVWYLLPTGQDVVSKPIPAQEARQRIAIAVAREITALLTCSVDRKSVAPEQIAVLTRSHAEAKVIKEALARCRVPAVLYSAGSVLETREAEELGMVLRAAAAPSDPRLVRSALATDMMGARARDFVSNGDQSVAQWEVRWERVALYHQIWLDQGFFAMFSRLMRQEGVKQRLLPLVDGERRITNLLHLAELLHQAATTKRLGPAALLAWFETQQTHGSQGEEIRQLRLESDAHAVRILTTHKSKGLQFDIVFCPFTWAGASVAKGALTFHDPEQDNHPTLDLRTDPDSRHRHQSLQELLAENLRLLYVALTRARKRCYWVWGRINKTDLSAPAYLLHASGAAAADIPAWLACAKQSMAALTDAGFINDLKELAKNAPGAIALAPLPEDAPVARGLSGDGAAQQKEDRCRTLRRTLDKQWRIASFSSLTAGSHTGGEDDPDRDQAWADALPSIDGQQPDLFSFPGGARAGLFFHDLLEHWDFTCKDPLQRNTLVKEKLAVHGYDALWIPAVENLLVNLAGARLPDAAGSGFRLDQIPAGDRISEMDFHFPITQLRPESLQRLIASGHGTRQVKSLPSLHGYMKGFIDMVLRHNQRYYLVDWKSNFLGSRLENYFPDQLARAMDEANYTLQYLIYAAALDNYLSSKLPGYDYTRHFGGVYYIFLRGIRAGNEHNSGIFYTLPEPGMIEAVHAALGDDPGDCGR